MCTRRLFGRPRSLTKASSTSVTWKTRKLALGASVETLSRMAVDDRQDPERTSIEKAVGHEVHRPDLVWYADGGLSLPVAPGPLALGQLGPD